MSERVERVARAILKSREARGDIHKQMYWQTVADTAWKSVEADARAAIEAMREPDYAAQEARDIIGYCTDCENQTRVHNGRCGCGSGRVITFPAGWTLAPPGSRVVPLGGVDAETVERCIAEIDCGCERDHCSSAGFCAKDDAAALRALAEAKPDPGDAQ